MRLVLPILLAVLGLTAGFAFYVVQEVPGLRLAPELIERAAQLPLVETTEVMETIAEEISTPPPLRGRMDQAAGTLSASGILSETNKQRSAAGLPPLAGNAVLNRAAENKLTDMFTQQYFEHTSPDGKGPADVAAGAGYMFLRVGENLALGNFSSDAELVEAWMNSPGHRANILAEGFSELGVAAASGVFEGQTTWLAVQTFGLPSSSCPAPEQALRDAFAAQQEQLNQQQAELAPLAEQVSDLAEQASAKVEAGNELIRQGNEAAAAGAPQSEAEALWEQGKALQEEGQGLAQEARALRDIYNSKVSAVNNLADQTTALVETLNGQVKTYNDCLEGFSD
jgi:uncharacterized protein YkwD